MTHAVEAIYENGVLRPLEPLPLGELERVSVLVSTHGAQLRGGYIDATLLEAAKREVAAKGEVPTLEEVRKITSVDPSSWADAVIAEREERF
ncbi:MAG: antitoxin family protein [Terriglobales bacterium]